MSQTSETATTRERGASPSGSRWLLVAAGLLGYAIAPTFWFIVFVAAVIGFGSGAVDAALNYYASEHFSVTVMNLPAPAGTVTSTQELIAFTKAPR